MSPSGSPTPILSGRGSRLKTEIIDFAGSRSRTLPPSGSPTPILSGRGSRSETEIIGFAGSRARTLSPSSSPTPILSGRGSRLKTEIIDFAGRRTQTPPAPGRSLCSPLPANPYAFVSGSKIFTQLPAAKCIFARTPAGLFAPPCPQILMPSFRGAKSSHSCRPLNAFSPAHRPASLLPLARKSLCLRFGEQKPLQRFRTAAGVSLLYPYILYACISTYSS